MANEIYHSYDSSYTLYALVYRQDDGYIWDVGDAAFEAVGTWNDARVDECDIAMTQSSDLHYADFPAIGEDSTCFVQVRVQAGASPDTDDMIVAQGIIHWSGTGDTESEIDTGSIVDAIKFRTDVFDETEPEQDTRRVYL